MKNQNDFGKTYS